MRGLGRWLVGGEAEGGGEQGGKRGGDRFAAGGGVKDCSFGGGELEDGLAAGSAGHAGSTVEVGDGDGAEAYGRAVKGDGGSNGSLLGARGKTVGGVFDVCANDDGSGLAVVCVEQDRGADAEVTVWGVGIVGSFGGALVEGGNLFGCEVGRHR